MNNMVSGSIVTFNNISTIEKRLKQFLLKLRILILNFTLLITAQVTERLNLLKRIIPQVSVIRNEKKNVGFGAGHNIILTPVESSYHAIINPDIVLKEKM